MSLKACAYAAALTLGVAQAVAADGPPRPTAPGLTADSPRVLSLVELERVSAGADISGSAQALAAGPFTSVETRTAGIVSSREVVPGVTSGNATVAAFGRASAPNGAASTQAATSADAPEAGGSQLRIGINRNVNVPFLGFSSSVSASSSAATFPNPLMR